jgi:thiosulfate dehydrogenase (quinone) large subunit
MQAPLEGTVMTATTQPVHPTVHPDTVTPTLGDQPGEDSAHQQVSTPLFTRTNMAIRVFGGLARISLGWIFLWALLDKTFGLGHDTTTKDAWIHGGSPTFGFLNFGAVGPFKGFYNSIAGAGWADWLFMIGLLTIGVALILGVFMNLASTAGTLLLLMMWTVVLPPDSNPIIDDHIIYALALGVLACLGAGRFLGLGNWWEQTPLVRKLPVLR